MGTRFIYKLSTLHFDIRGLSTIYKRSRARVLSMQTETAPINPVVEVRTEGNHAVLRASCGGCKVSYVKILQLLELARTWNADASVEFFGAQNHVESESVARPGSDSTVCQRPLGNGPVSCIPVPGIITLTLQKMTGILTCDQWRQLCVEVLASQFSHSVYHPHSATLEISFFTQADRSAADLFSPHQMQHAVSSYANHAVLHTGRILSRVHPWEMNLDQPSSKALRWLCALCIARSEFDELHPSCQVLDVAESGAAPRPELTLRIAATSNPSSISAITTQPINSPSMEATIATSANPFTFEFVMFMSSDRGLSDLHFDIDNRAVVFTCNTSPPVEPSIVPAVSAEDASGCGGVNAAATNSRACIVSQTGAPSGLSATGEVSGTSTRVSRWLGRVRSAIGRNRNGHRSKAKNAQPRVAWF